MYTHRHDDPSRPCWHACDDHDVNVIIWLMWDCHTLLSIFRFREVPGCSLMMSLRHTHKPHHSIIICCIYGLRWQLSERCHRWPDIINLKCQHDMSRDSPWCFWYWLVVEGGYIPQNPPSIYSVIWKIQENSDSSPVPLYNPSPRIFIEISYLDIFCAWSTDICGNAIYDIANTLYPWFVCVDNILS